MSKLNILKYVVLLGQCSGIHSVPQVERRRKMVLERARERQTAEKDLLDVEDEEAGTDEESSEYEEVGNPQIMLIVDFLLNELCSVNYKYILYYTRVRRHQIGMIIIHSIYISLFRSLKSMSCNTILSLV